MANNSDKRAELLYIKYKALYLQIILAVTFIHVFFRIYLSWESFTFVHILGFILFSVVNYYGYKMFMFYLRNYHPRTSYGVVEEILWVNLFLEVLTCISGYFWFLYLLVPGYAIYSYGPMVRNMLCPPRPVYNAENEEVAPTKTKVKVKKVY